MKKYTAFDEIIDHKGDLIKIEKSFNVDNAIINGGDSNPINTPCYAVGSPTCNCNPRIGHTFKVTGVKVNGIWFQSSFATLQPPTNPGPFSSDPCPNMQMEGVVLFSDFNNPLNPPQPWWNPGSIPPDPWHDFAWNTHATFHHIYGGGSQVSNPWEDAFYNRICQQVGWTQLTVGQKFSGTLGVHPMAQPGQPPGIHASWALSSGLIPWQDFAAAGIDWSGLTQPPYNNHDWITDICFEYTGYQLAWHRYPLFFDNFSTSSCLNIVDNDDNDDPCKYQIGDISDPTFGGAGGMIFALPNTPQNPTPYFYEVALDDLSTGNHPLEHNQTHIADPNITAEDNCGHIATTPIQHTFNCPWQAPIDTNIPNNMCRWGYGPGSFQPSITSPPGINTPTGVNVGDPIQALGSSQNQLYPPGTIIDDIIYIPAAAVNTLMVVGGVVVNLTALPYDSYLFLFSNSTVPTVPPFSQPIKILDTGGTPQQAGPFSQTGAEWGAWGEYLQFLSTDFGTGHLNTQHIVTWPAQPVWGTHDVAAELCANHQAFGPNERWFLPSLDEFELMYHMVGPNTSFASITNLYGQIEDMSDTYWTSSDNVDGGPGGGAGFHYAFAYNVTQPPYPAIPITPNPPGPVMAQRCSALSVRPIRRFKCVVPEPMPEEAYMWCDAFVKERGVTNSQNFQAKFTNYYSPGACGSGWGYFDSNDFTLTNYNGPLDTTIFRSEATIGGYKFTWQIASTDAGGNLWDLSDFDDANNPDGYTIKLWEADGTYLGTWHYQNVVSVNRVSNWMTQTAAQGQPAYMGWHDRIPQPDNPNAWTSKNFPDKISVEFENVTHIDGPYQIVNYGYSRERNPAYPLNNYPGAPWQDGHDVWRIFNSTGAPNGWSGIGYQNSIDLMSDFSNTATVHHTNYFNEYYEEAWGGWTCSFAFIQLNCDTAMAKLNAGGGVGNVSTGVNTVYQQKHVVCLKKPFTDLRYYANQFNHPQYLTSRSGGHIGIGGHSPFSTANTTSYATQQIGPDLLKNTTYGNVTVNGQPGHTPNPQPLDHWMPGLGPVTANSLSIFPVVSGGLANYPKHYLFPWCAEYIPPISSQLKHYNSLTDGLNAMNNEDACEAHDPCDYQIGDTGPAGGIIVATPYMNWNPSGNPLTEIVGPYVPPLQGDVVLKNPTNYYYELSPQNLNLTDCSNSSDEVAQWGFGGGFFLGMIDVTTAPETADAWIPDWTLYDIPVNLGGGSLLTFTGNPQEMELVGQSVSINDAYKNAVYPGGPWYDPTLGNVYTSACTFGVYSASIGAFKMCWDYYQGGFGDWFLPTVNEMEFARNYTLPGALYDSTSGGQSSAFDSPQNSLDTDGDGIIDYTGSKHYWTCNTYGQLDNDQVVKEDLFSSTNVPSSHGAIYCDNQGLFSGGTTNLDDYNNMHAYTVSMDPIIYSNPASTPDDHGWKTATKRDKNANVRAMRRFECGEWTGPVDPGIDYNFRFEALGGGYPFIPGKWGRIESSMVQDPVSYNYSFPWGDYSDPSYRHGWIGDTYCTLYSHLFDVVGNNWYPAQYKDWIITVYSQDEILLGKWVYEMYHWTSCSFTCDAMHIRMYLKPGVPQSPPIDLWNHTNTQYHFSDDQVIFTGPPAWGNYATHDPTNEYKYIKVEVKEPTYSFPNTFGNTLNLMDHLGSGINRRVLPGQPTNIMWPKVCLDPFCPPPNAQWQSCVKMFSEVPLNPMLTSCNMGSFPMDWCGTNPPSANKEGVRLDIKPGKNECLISNEEEIEKELKDADLQKEIREAQEEKIKAIEENKKLKNIEENDKRTY